MIDVPTLKTRFNENYLSAEKKSLKCIYFKRTKTNLLTLMWNLVFTWK